MGSQRSPLSGEPNFKTFQNSYDIMKPGLLKPCDLFDITLESLIQNKRFVQVLKLHGAEFRNRQSLQLQFQIYFDM